jgi:hypothetical protein
MEQAIEDYKQMGTPRPVETAFDSVLRAVAAVATADNRLAAALQPERIVLYCI